MSDHTMPNGEKTWVVSESDLYDLLASNAAAMFAYGMSGGALPETRDETITMLRGFFPPYLLAGAIAYTQEGRPKDRIVEFMRRDADAAVDAGDLEVATSLWKSLAEIEGEE